MSTLLLGLVGLGGITALGLTLRQRRRFTAVWNRRRPTATEAILMRRHLVIPLHITPDLTVAMPSVRHPDRQVLHVDHWDQYVEVRADDRRAMLATLGDCARRTLEPVLERLDARVANGCLVVHRSRLQGGSEALIAERLEACDRVAATVKTPSDATRALCEHLAGDPEPGFRYACLEALLGCTAAAGLAFGPVRDALVHALSDPDSEIRLHAAIALGPAGRATLGQLVANASLAPGIRARAAVAQRHLGVDPPLSAISALMAFEDPHIRHLALTALEGHPDPATDLLLVEVLLDAPTSLACRAAAQLGQRASPTARKPLESVARGPFRSAELRASARRALGRIETQGARVEVGRVSIANHGGGTLSFAEPAPHEDPP